MHVFITNFYSYVYVIGDPRCVIMFSVAICLGVPIETLQVATCLTYLLIFTVIVIITVTSIHIKKSIHFVPVA